jgi:hypothetical protein
VFEKSTRPATRSVTRSERAIDDRARHKDNLGYHDIRVGNTPDVRLLKFITHNILLVAEDSRFNFD